MLWCKGLTTAFTFLRVKLSVAEPYLQGRGGGGGRAVLCVCACVCVCVCVSLKTLRQIFSGRVICDAKTYISPSLTPSEIALNLVHSKTSIEIEILLI